MVPAISDSVASCYALLLVTFPSASTRLTYKMPGAKGTIARTFVGERDQHRLGTVRRVVVVMLGAGTNLFGWVGGRFDTARRLGLLRISSPTDAKPICSPSLFWSLSGCLC